VRYEREGLKRRVGAIERRERKRKKGRGGGKGE